jgi:hypothetical protein
VWHAVVCAAVIAWILTAFWGFSYTRSIYLRRNAEGLLHQLRLLQSGAAGASSTQEIANKFGGTRHCAAGVCTYDFQVVFPSMHPGSPLTLRRTEWDYVGLRPWRFTAQIQVSNGEVTRIEADALVARGRGWLYNEGLLSGNDWGWWSTYVLVSSERFESVLRVEKEVAGANRIGKRGVEPGTDGIIVRKPSLNIQGGGEALSMTLSPAAKPNAKEVGFDMNLRCATNMASCTELCQLAPSAWQVYSRFQRSNGWWADQPVNCNIP